MRASRGMGCIAPSKMPSGKRKARRDDTDFTEYAKGGWIKDAIKKPGKIGQRARLAQTLKKMKG